MLEILLLLLKPSYSVQHSFEGSEQFCRDNNHGTS